MSDAVPLATELLALLFSPAVDRWVERFDAWVEGLNVRGLNT
jgi:hypothetical protein